MLSILSHILLSLLNALAVLSSLFVLFCLTASSKHYIKYEFFAVSWTRGLSDGFSLSYASIATIPSASISASTTDSDVVVALSLVRAQGDAFFRGQVVVAETLSTQILLASLSAPATTRCPTSVRVVGGALSRWSPYPM